MTTATKATTTAVKDGLPSMIAYLTRVLKTPTIGAFWETWPPRHATRTGPTRSTWPPCCSARSPTGSQKAR